MRRTNKEIISALELKATEEFNRIVIFAKHSGYFDGDLRRLYRIIEEMAHRSHKELAPS